jgi:HAMP domain-containing protein
MKKPYQIESQRAVKQLEQMVDDGNPAVQMVVPMAEMVGWLRKGVGELIRQAGFTAHRAADGGRSPGVGGRAEPAEL